MLGRSSKDTGRFPDDRKVTGETTSTPLKKESRMVDDLTAPKDMNTFIAKGSEFVGKLTFEGTVRIDGKIDGEIFSKGTLIIGPGADIKAKINVDTVIISGNVNGNVTARKKIELRAPAKLKGNMLTPSLVIEEGVMYEGNCRMEKNIGDHEPAPAPRPEPKQQELKAEGAQE